jgi:hypothetical protein
VPNTNDGPEARKAIWFASERVPASVTTMTWPSWWADSNALVTDVILVGSALWPSHASMATRNPACVSQQAKSGLRVPAPFLGKPRLAESATGIDFEVQRGHVKQH